MCTAVTYKTKDFYFGRNLDLEYRYNENVTVTPRCYPFHFRNGEVMERHFAMIGMATVVDGYPLYYEATNEAGLSVAGLNFPRNAVYQPKRDDRDNVAPFEFIPWILGKCETVNEAVRLMEKMNLWNTPFSEQFPLSPLHWIIADKNRAVTAEPLERGTVIYENPVGVLTNNPPFDYHMYNLANYMTLTSDPPENRFGGNMELSPYSLGMGAIGLPGDPSSASRFVRASFTKMNSPIMESEAESVTQFFHILGSVEQQKGVTCVRAGEYEYTVYSSCCNTDTGVYYYTTYNNSCICAVDMKKEDPFGERVVSYPLSESPRILFQN